MHCNGEYMSHSVDGSLMRTGSDKGVSVIGISRDISARKEEDACILQLHREKNYLMQEINHQ